MLAPSLMSAISFIQWFGNQGVLKALLGGASVYGAPGIILARGLRDLPARADDRADGAVCWRTAACTRPPNRCVRRAGASSSRSRCPARKYGLISATMVVFSYTVSDFGMPKVIGGNFNVLGGGHLQAGHRPAELQQGRGGGPDAAAAGDRSRSSSTGSCSAGCRRSSRHARCPYAPKPRTRGSTRDARVLHRSCALLLLAVLGMAVYTSFIKLWPYDLSLTPAATTASA